MVEKQKLEEIIKRNTEKYKLDNDFYLKKDLKAKQINNSLERFAQGCREQDIVAMMDSTLFSSGKEGFVFTDSAFYSHYLKKDKSISNPLKYEDIAAAKVGRNEYYVTFLFKDGSKIEDVYFSICGSFVIGMMTDILELDEKQSRSESAAEKQDAQEKASAEAKKPARKKKTAQKALVKSAPVVTKPVAAAEAVSGVAEPSPIQTVSAADAGTVKELIEQADNAYYEECDYKQAFNLYMKAAELSSAYACQRVAMCYVDDESVEYDDTKYLEWLNKAISLARPAAEQGNAEAQYVLGDTLYLLDGDDEETKNQAKQWLLKSAAQGNSSAQTDLKSNFKMTSKAIDAAVQEMAERLKAEAERKAAEEAAAQAKAEAENKTVEKATVQAKAEAEQKVAEELVAKPAAQPSVAPDENDPMVKMVRRMLDAGKLTHEEISEYSGLPLKTIEMLDGPDMNDPMVQMANRLLSSGKLTCEEVAEYSAIPLADVQKLAAQQGKTTSSTDSEKAKAEATQKEAAAKAAKAKAEAERKAAEEAAAKAKAEAERKAAEEAAAKAKAEAERKAAEEAAANSMMTAEQIRQKADKAYDAHNYEEAYSLYLKAVELGDAEAAYNVARLYASGYGVERSSKLEQQWYRKAASMSRPLAEQGDGNAQYMLGKCLLNFEEDELEGRIWIHYSARYGNASARYHERHKFAPFSDSEIFIAIDKVEFNAKKAGKKLTPAEEVSAVLAECNYRENIRVGVIGHIGHGKSTLTAAITKVQALKKRAKAVDVETLDHVSEERVCGISTKTAHVEYETTERHYSHIDCPRHEDYIKNMITDSVQMDGAILVVDVTEGLMPQAKKHIRLAKKVGIPRIIVFMNKIDQVGDEELADLIEMTIREDLDIYDFNGGDCPVIRGSAERVLRSTSTDPDAPEYRCIHELLEAMDKYIPSPCLDDEKSFLMPVDDVMTITGLGTIAAGKVARGTLHTGESVEIVGLKDESKRAEITSIKMHKKVVDEIRTGDEATLQMRSVARDGIARGQVLATVASIHPYHKFTAQVYVLTKEEGGRNNPLVSKYCPQIVVGAADVTGIINLPEGIDIAMPGDYIEMNIELLNPLALECGTRFSLREGGRTIGVGCVTRVGDWKNQF